MITTTNQEKIAWLKRYNVLDRRIQSRFNECERLRSQLGKITTTLTDMPAGGGSIHKSFDHDTINRIIDMIAEMEKDCNDWVDARMEIEAAIRTVEGEQERELLEYRYLQGWTFEKIAGEISYSWRWTHRLHSQALKQLEINVCR